MVGIHVDAYAEEMAIGLAILHWKAGIDAQDTEFVIGCSATKTFATVYSDHGSVQPPASTTDDFTERETQLWMLDFDKCSKIDLEDKALSSSQVVEKYMVAVTGNDPYFPHPCLVVDLWRKFRRAYLKASEILIKHRRLGRRVAKLPLMLMEQCEKWGEKDLEAEEYDPFERHSDDEEAEILSEQSSSDDREDDDDEDD
ncbi:hypothetical protein A1O1_04386 [Capronia coronata CBS 617.96]|uniref:DUF3669 domain-containing protein n=1 Tax=Capronia coronata CBS 617.96 TaxID=1182541 RepID=W9YPV6_9EURO|nr:uncharacterized protein A1O1_04386 [Capronia coronata CBS 617.96]EXJ91276.1 hypothetical protein A1O1_04386 [Capronia coronata CBS 617.96]